eukprot:6538332-Pyramimonas_sp.AAC.1
MELEAASAAPDMSVLGNYVIARGGFYHEYGAASSDGAGAPWTAFFQVGGADLLPRIAGADRVEGGECRPVAGAKRIEGRAVCALTSASDPSAGGLPRRHLLFRLLTVASDSSFSIATSTPPPGTPSPLESSQQSSVTQVSHSRQSSVTQVSHSSRSWRFEIAPLHHWRIRFSPPQGGSFSSVSATTVR